MEKLKVLANYLECEVTDLEQCQFNNEYITVGDSEYIVLTDDEADDKTAEYIKDSLWAFNTKFILEHSKVDESYNIKKAIEKMQCELCEDANEIVSALIDDIDAFIYDAIGCDGRGHFLSGYDGEEVERDGYYIYRTN